MNAHNQEPEDVVATPEAGQAENAPVEKEVTPPPKTRSTFWSRAFRWILVLLIVFGLGAMLIALVFYVPLRNQMGNRQTDLQAANQKINELTDRVESLTALETKNKDLQTKLDQANLQIELLHARADIYAAQLAITKNDLSMARVALKNTPNTLKNLENQLEPDQKKVVTDMQNRLSLALGELDNNTYAAQSDLDVLGRSLLELENALIR